MKRDSLVTAFTRTELLIVIAVLALLATTQLPALTRAKAPVHFTQCLNNLRQIGQATLIYKADNNDAYPFGNRCFGPGTGTGSVLDPTCWPMQLLRYLGGYKTNSQPMVYVCPSENGLPAWFPQVQYVSSRYLLSDTDARPTAITGAMVRNPDIYWMFMDKSPGQYCNITAGGLGTILAAWNYPPGLPAFRRHNGGVEAAAADGHVECLRMPLYQPTAPAPKNFLELGDCASGVNPASTWWDITTPGNHNGYRVKLYSRFTQSASGQPPF